ncbi:MAG: hypothetical protein KBS76_04445 [Ruminococcus sp.]|nr:hypothetical protein [Candidatus Apopatosoma intestinale]
MKANYGTKRKRTPAELEKEFSDRIEFLSAQVKSALQLPIASDMRTQYANTIAVTLRALVTYTTNCESLCKRCNYDSSLFFPLYSPMAAQNLVPQYNLVGVSCNGKDKTCVFCVNEDLDNKDIVRSTYMTFEKWKNEIIIDFLSNGFKPLSRENVIRIVADKLGAHVDSAIEERLYKIENDDILPITVVQNGIKYKGDGRNLFCETIIGIAIELVFAFHYTMWYQFPVAMNAKPATVYQQDYDGVQKYTVCYLDNINAYNANHYFSCTVTKYPLKMYRLPFREKIFDIGIIGK